MYVKKNLKLWLSVLALALPLLFVGTASAKYQSDGAVQNGTTGGWTAPTDGICVLGLHADGTMDVDATILTKRDCDARLVSVTAVTTNDTLANVCVKGALNTAGVRYAAPGGSVCVTIDGSGNILSSKSMVNNDRNALICNQLGGQLGNATVATLANGAAITVATKTVADGTAAQCVAYGWQYRGQDATGTPLTFGTKGVDNTVTPTTQAGFCYTTMRTTLAVASCPTVVGSTSGTANSSATAAFGYSVSGTYCLYAYGINGPVSAALSNAVTSAAVAAAGATINMGAFTTQGACLANGGTWLNWIPQGSTATVGALNGITSAITFDTTRQLVNSDEGCLHCHSTLVQQNADVYRQKDSYLKTGHKNMLRKVTPGMNWAGPNASGVLTVYTTDGTNAMTWGTLGVPGSALDGVNPMYYIYGDWMALNPSVAIAGSKYGCANCHATGFSGGTAATPGVQSIGTPGYIGTQPADAGAAYVSAVAAGYAWDLEGINCSRCHNAAGPSVTQTMISGGTCKNGATDVTAAYPTQTACAAASYTWTAIGTASAFPTTHPTSAGMGSLAAGTGINNLCFGCHQSIAKLWPAQGGSSSGTAQHDPTLIPTGVSHGAAVGRDFNGHVLGNSFLNSVHARYAGAQSGNGSITANSLAENDLTDPNGTTEYNSIFKGYTCFQGAGSSDVALTDASGNALTMTSCNALYGAGSWAVDTNGAQGTCTTCHDVHNSLFVASQEAKAIKKTCEDCHVNNATTGATDAAAPQVVVSSINHPMSAGTPFDTSRYDNACVVCHMATQAEANGDQNTMPAHVWRINTNASYNTFPTVTQFYGGSCSGHGGALTAAATAFVPAVYWSDLASANCTTIGTWTAATMDRNAQTAPDDKNYAKAVWVDIDMACGQCHGGSGGTTATHNNAPYFTKTALATGAANMHSAPVCTASVPVVSHGTVTQTGYTVSFTDSSTDSGDTSKLDAVTVNWGDGTATDTGIRGSVFTHTFTGRARTVSIVHMVRNSCVTTVYAKEILKLTVPVRYNVTGTVFQSNGTTAITSAYVYLKQSNHTKQVVKSDATTGAFTFTNVLPGSYTIHVYKSGVTFGADVPVTVTSANVAQNVTAVTP